MQVRNLYICFTFYYVTLNYATSLFKVQLFFDIQDYYCLVEYATPILSLYEMSNSEEAGLSSFERLQQMRTFVATLQDIINSNPETKNNCSLLVYDGKRNSL